MSYVSKYLIFYHSYTTSIGSIERAPRGGRRRPRSMLAPWALGASRRRTHGNRAPFACGDRSAASRRLPIAELLVGNALVLVLLLAEGVRAVSDGQLEPVSCTKWLYGIGGVFFVFIVMPPGVFGGREGVDPVIAFTICWTIIGCWTLRGIAN